MSGTAKTILIVGGAAVGVYFLWKMLQPKVAPRPAASATGSLAHQLVTEVAGALPSVFKAFSSSSGAQPAPTFTAYDQGGFVGSGNVDTSAQASYALSHGVVEQQGNVLVDQNTGNALVYGTE